MLRRLHEAARGTHRRFDGRDDQKVTALLSWLRLIVESGVDAFLDQLEPAGASGFGAPLGEDDSDCLDRSASRAR